MPESQHSYKCVRHPVIPDSVGSSVEGGHSIKLHILYIYTNGVFSKKKNKILVKYEIRSLSQTTYTKTKFIN